jgi:hypothetical protein
MLLSDDLGRLIPEDDFNPSQLRDVLAQLQKPASLVAIISNERLAGHPLSNGFDRRLLAQRIRDVFPQARILLTIREQKAIIMSNYMQYLKFGGWHSPELFVRPPSDMRQPVLTLQFWDYAKLIRLYHSVFGRHNVLVLPQEILRRSPTEFVKRIAAFAGLKARDSIEFAQVEANPRRPHVPYYYLRKFSSLYRKSSGNAFFPSLIGPTAGKLIDKGLKTLFSALTPYRLEKRLEKSLFKRIELMVGDYYAPSNRVASELIGIDLAELGYPCSNSAECDPSKADQQGVQAEA